MKKENCKIINLKKGVIREYQIKDIKLLAYQTNDFIDDEVFILVKNQKGICIELPCFYDNISELTDYINGNGIDLVAKFVAYHAAGASFMPEVKSFGTKTSNEYNTIGSGAGLEAFDIEIPEINCVYTHMMGHNCHSIVAGCPHADGIISQLNYYVRKGFDLILTSHYTPEDLKDAKTKIDYLYDLKAISETCNNAEEMKQKVIDKYSNYSGLNYLDMTVSMFFPAK